MVGRTAIRVARIVGGVAFLVLGVIGLFLPFLQGILFLGIGMALLSQESERARRWSEWLQERLHLPRKKHIEGTEK